MLRVHAFRLMGAISRLGCGEGLRDCEYGGGRGRWCVINADHRIVNIRIRIKRYLLYARCKTEVYPSWSHMLPDSRVVLLPFSLVQSLGLVREMELFISESRMSQVADF